MRGEAAEKWEVEAMPTRARANSFEFGIGSENNNKS
jgi:hypothetical protein